MDCDYIFEVLDAIDCGQIELMRKHRKNLVQRLHIIADNITQRRQTLSSRNVTGS